MQAQNYGRIMMTTSSSGMYGNFGQSNYGAAKMAVLGLMNTLVIEGKKHNILVNALAPTAATRMTQDLLPQPVLDMLTLEAVTAGALTLCHQDAPNRFILCAGAGGYSNTRLLETEGIFLAPEEQTPEQVKTNWSELIDSDKQEEYLAGAKQAEKFLMKAMSYVQKQNRD
jgi:NAD(P)-dependent dehydrogenase (short-subunit alcohol dehydrogenase family)